MVLGSVSAVDEVNTGPVFEVCSSNIVVLGSVSAVDEVNTGQVFEVFPSTTVLLGSVAAVIKVGPAFEVCSATTVLLGSVAVVGEVKIGPQFGMDRSLLEMKGISYSSMSPLLLFEGALTIATTTTTHIITITVVAPIATVSLAVVFMVIIFPVEIVVVAVVFMDNAMVFVVVVVAAVVVVNIDPGECVNMSIFFALEFTQETPQSICSKDVALSNIWDMSMTAETSHADRSWLKHRAR